MVRARRSAAAFNTSDQHAYQVNEPEGVRHPRKRVKPSSQTQTAIESDDEPRYFLMKAEPESRIEKGIDVKFSIDDLKRAGTEPWDGVRNAEASKTMRTRMKLGDQAFFYHSNTKNPGIAGIATVAKEGYPDSSAWDAEHPYFDPKTNKDRPKWWRVDVKYQRHLSRFVSLRELKQGNFPELCNMQLLKRPQLSVQRVTSEEWSTILQLEKNAPDNAAFNNENPASIASGVESDDELSKSRARERDEEIKAQIMHTHGGSPE